MSPGNVWVITQSFSATCHIYTPYNQPFSSDNFLSEIIERYESGPPFSLQRGFISDVTLQNARCHKIVFLY